MSVLEQTRSLHEELEKQEQLLIQSLLHAPSAPANSASVDPTTPNITPSITLPSLRTLIQHHSIRTQLDSFISHQQQLQQLYADADNLNQTQLEAMIGEKMWSSYYQQIADMKMKHVKQTNNPSSTTDSSTSTATMTSVPAPSIRSLFSSIEQSGHHLDLNSFYQLYINLPQFIRFSPSGSRLHTDYLTYLSSLPTHFYSISSASKLHPLAAAQAYREYVKGLYEYLRGYHERLYPLVNQNQLRKMIEEDFEERWKRKEVKGWFSNASDETSTTTNSTSLSPSPSPSPSPSSIPPSSESKESNSLYCNACQKTFAKETVYTAHLKGKKHLKAAGTISPSSSNTTNNSSSSSSSPSSFSSSSLDFSLALLEDLTFHYLSLLSSLLSTTIINLEKKQTKTYEELRVEQERKEREEEEEERKIMELANKAWDDSALSNNGNENESKEDSDDSSTIYNPLNLPLGWDGKPIPYWLYKLHGLNIEYSCQICGNYTYRGPRNYERHFNEWRHVYGLRCLGIENRREFMYITNIEDAEKLWEKLKGSGITGGTSGGGGGRKWMADEEEEVEDREGNVFNKKTYIQLQKQGILD